jgi:hypothetical protein
MKPVSGRLLAAVAAGIVMNAQLASLKAEDLSASQVSQVVKRLQNQGYKGVRQLSQPQAQIPRRSSFYERVLVLGQQGGTMHAIVPLGSVLHLPDHLRDHILSKPEGKLVAWETLLKNSRTWLGTQEISQAAARGNSHEIDLLTAQLASERRIIIAVSQARPVPVLQRAKESSQIPDKNPATSLNSR